MSERQLKEIAFALIYQRLFNHGTDGHHLLLLIAEQAAEIGYQVQFDIHVDETPAPDFGTDAHVGVFSCNLMLQKDGQPVLKFNNLIGEE